jgi:hypothetical protein
MNLEQFAGNEYINTEDEKPRSRERSNLNQNRSNRILEPLFPPTGKSAPDFSKSNVNSHKSINFYNNIGQPKLDMIHEDSDMI